MKIKKLIVAMSVSSLSFSYTPSAHAVCDACVVASVQAASLTITAAISSLSGNLTAQAQRIILALGSGVATITGQEARSAELVVQGNQRTEAAMEQNRQDDRYQVTDACSVLASTRGMSSAGRKGPSLGGGIGRGGGLSGGGTGLSSDMQKALTIASGGDAPPSPEVQAAYASSGACSSFVSSSSNKVRAETCTLAGYSASASSGYPDADIRAETLFDGPQTSAKASEFRRRLTVDPDGTEASVLSAFLRNLNTPVELQQLRKGELKTDMGRQFMAYKDSYEARMSLAEKPARSMVGDRLANKDLIPVIEQMLESPVMGPYVRSYLTENYPKWSSKGISLDELMNLEGERRYMNRNWHLLMASAPPEAHVKEQTNMMALQTVLMTRILGRLQEQSAVTGQVAATQVRQEMMPQLIQLHAAASK